MSSTFPHAVPEIPVADMNQAVEYYEKNLGFQRDWGGAEGGIAGMSKGNCRVFLTDASFREHYGNRGPIMTWLNLNNKHEVRELHAQWKKDGAKLLSEPEEKPWKLIEFIAADIDGNLFRVFYDFRHDD